MGSQQRQTPLISQSQDQFFDFFRANLKASADATRTSLENAIRLRTNQLRILDETLAAHARLSAEIDAAKGIEGLSAVSGKLAGAQYRTLISYWAAIYEAIGENQVELAKLVQSQATQIQNDLGDKVNAAAPGGPVPVLAALQPLMEIASSAYALTARATAEATKLAAVQLTSANPAKPAQQARQRAA